MEKVDIRLLAWEAGRCEFVRRGKCVTIGVKDGEDALAVCDEEEDGGDVGGGEDTAAAMICCCAPTSGGSALDAQNVLCSSTRPFHYIHIHIRVHDFDVPQLFMF